MHSPPCRAAHDRQRNGSRASRRRPFLRVAKRAAERVPRRPSGPRRPSRPSLHRRSPLTRPKHGRSRPTRRRSVRPMPGEQARATGGGQGTGPCDGGGDPAHRERSTHAAPQHGRGGSRAGARRKGAPLRARPRRRLRQHHASRNRGGDDRRRFGRRGPPCQEGARLSRCDAAQPTLQSPSLPPRRIGRRCL